jgi:hypothetical protein
LYNLKIDPLRGRKKDGGKDDLAPSGSWVLLCRDPLTPSFLADTTDWSVAVRETKEESSYLLRFPDDPPSRHTYELNHIWVDFESSEDLSTLCGAYESNRVLRSPPTSMTIEALHVQPSGLG